MVSIGVEYIIRFGWTLAGSKGVEIRRLITRLNNLFLTSSWRRWCTRCTSFLRNETIEFDETKTPHRFYRCRFGCGVDFMDADEKRIIHDGETF